MPDVISFSGEHRCFSNFFPAPIVWRRQNGSTVTFPTNEHGFVWHKTNNPVVKKVVLTIEKPGQVKRFGRGIVLRDDWEEVKLTIMSQLVLIKFRQHPRLLEILLATENGQLIEGNHWHDTFWGVCNGKCRQGPHKPVGENHLGQILMRTREQMR